MWFFAFHFVRFFAMEGVDKMSFIMVKHITKTFKVSEKRNTKFATLKNFFNRKYKYIKAIDDISFSIDEFSTVSFLLFFAKTLLLKINVNIRQTQSMYIIIFFIFFNHFNYIIFCTTISRASFR